MLLSVCINGTISNKAVLNLSNSLAFVPHGASGRSLCAFTSVPPSSFGTSEARAGQPLPPGDANFYLLLNEKAG